MVVLPSMLRWPAEPSPHNWFYS